MKNRRYIYKNKQSLQMNFGFFRIKKNVYITVFFLNWEWIIGEKYFHKYTEKQKKLNLKGRKQLCVLFMYMLQKLYFIIHFRLVISLLKTSFLLNYEWEIKQQLDTRRRIRINSNLKNNSLPGFYLSRIWYVL